ncbi:MAG: glycyl-radical enzyme activating protein [Oscillospiraceae bacterium]
MCLCSCGSQKKDRAYDGNAEGIVFNIQRFTVHDGPGIRTEVFLKGCTLRCRWCSNPESISPERTVGVYQAKCIGIERCGACIKACPHALEGAIIVEDGKVTGINRRICDNCFKCQEACPSDALKEWGRRMTVSDVMELILQDRNFFSKSGGGVTISGGEALRQYEFVRAILQACRKENISTCVETASNVSPEALEAVIPYTDMFITDIKHLDSEVHRKNTGAGNELILKNIRRLAETGKPLILRLPVIPGVNDSPEYIDSVGEFIKENLGDAVRQIQFLRFRRLGEEKYKSLGLPYNMGDIDIGREEFEEKIRLLVERMKEQGLPAVAGTNSAITW